ncbi:MAG: hypothetical protein PSV16_04660 [Flavobacterium sp.]|nr:hypothetical protein [Flavobacterium sp.]
MLLSNICYLHPDIYLRQTISYLYAMQYNRNNFHKHTFCVFNEVNFSEIASKQPNYTSDSGSAYYFTDEGVFRLSNHWGRAAKCKWRLQSTQDYDKRLRLGYAKWTDFQDDNSSEKLYFIEVDFEAKTAAYQHKNNFIGTELPIFRTASDASKMIKQIRNLLYSEDWARHFDMKIDDLREVIVSELVSTSKTLQQIKSGLL